MKSASPPPFFPTPATPATQATERKDLPRSEVVSINSRCLGNDQRFSPGEDRGSCGNRAYYHGRITAPTQPFFSHQAMFLRSRSWRLKSCGPTEHWVIFYKVWNRIVWRFDPSSSTANTGDLRYLYQMQTAIKVTNNSSTPCVLIPQLISFWSFGCGNMTMKDLRSR